MRPAREIMADARDEAPFSNGTEGYGWMENWCWAPCMNPVEVAWREYEEGERAEQLEGYEGGCPLIMCAMIGKTPVEWLDTWDGEGPYPRDRFHCIEFRGPDDGDDPEPQPVPDPPNMDALFPRPEPHPRMYVQPEQEVLV